MPNHHYVPQFYLRRFGTDTQVSAILMNHDFRFVESTKTKGQSSKPDYYRFPEVESIFGQIEGDASRLMRNISGYVPLVEDDAIFLKQYAAFQMMRTPAFVQTIGNLVDEGMSSVLSTYGEHKLSKEVMDSIGFPDAEKSAWRHLGASGAVVWTGVAAAGRDYWDKLNAPRWYWCRRTGSLHWWRSVPSCLAGLRPSPTSSTWCCEPAEPVALPQPCGDWREI